MEKLVRWVAGRGNWIGEIMRSRLSSAKPGLQRETAYGNINTSGSGMLSDMSISKWSSSSNEQWKLNKSKLKTYFKIEFQFSNFFPSTVLVRQNSSSSAFSLASSVTSNEAYPALSSTLYPSPLWNTITQASPDSSKPSSDPSYFTSQAWSFWALSPPWWTPSWQAPVTPQGCSS